MQEFTASTQAFLTGVDDIGLGAEIMFSTEGVASMLSNLVRGMAYVTVTYESHTTPVLSSAHAFLKINGNVRKNVSCGIACFPVCTLSENAPTTSKTDVFFISTVF